MFPQVLASSAWGRAQFALTPEGFGHASTSKVVIRRPEAQQCQNRGGNTGAQNTIDRGLAVLPQVALRDFPPGGCLGRRNIRKVVFRSEQELLQGGSQPELVQREGGQLFHEPTHRYLCALCSSKKCQHLGFAVPCSASSVQRLFCQGSIVGAGRATPPTNN